MSEGMLAKIKTEGYQNSQAMIMLGEFVDVYGQRLTGSREYLAAATWMSDYDSSSIACVTPMLRQSTV